MKKKKMKKKYKSVITKRIFKSIKKLAVVFCFLFLILGMGKIQGTSSYFSDTASSSGNTMTAGYWIPILTMSVSPTNPDGNNDFYASNPCVTLSETIGGVSGDATIYYEFSNDGDPISGGTVYPGVCVSVPDGEWDFQAQAVNNENPSWTSNIVADHFKVDTIDPIVEITAPDDKDSVFETVGIKATVTDNNLKKYNLVINDSSNATVYNSGDVLTAVSFTDQNIYNWDISGLNSGIYTLTLEGEDQAGNVKSNSIDVTVVKSGDIVINEVMWMGTLGHDADEWIELRNTTSHEIKIEDLGILNAKHSSGNVLGIPDGEKISANGYYLISNYDKNDSSSALNVDVDLVDSSISLNNSNNGNLVLQSVSGTVIDQARDGVLWPAGWHGILLHMSMERNNTPGNGLSGGSWHTCVDGNCNDGTYWDNDNGADFGTPGAPNLSVNDPSAPEYDPAFMEQEYFDEQEQNAVDEEILPAEEAGVFDPVVNPAVDPTPTPAPDATPAPTLTPEITPTPIPEVTPTPDVAPILTPEITPTPKPTETPEPTPDPTPEPKKEPDPTPEPKDESAPAEVAPQE